VRILPTEPNGASGIISIQNDCNKKGDRSMKVTINKKKCIGCGTCAAFAPELFSVEGGTATLIKNPGAYTDADKKKAGQAAANCPTEAIEIDK
jgi:ferredoxin